MKQSTWRKQDKKRKNKIQFKKTKDRLGYLNGKPYPLIRLALLFFGNKFLLGYFISQGLIVNKRDETLFQWNHSWIFYFVLSFVLYCKLFNGHPPRTPQQITFHHR